MSIHQTKETKVSLTVGKKQSWKAKPANIVKIWIRQKRDHPVESWWWFVSRKSLTI